MSNLIYRYQTARKEHRCIEPRCSYHGIISPGQRYMKEIYPPWTMTLDDPEGKPFPIGAWIVTKWHLECDPRYEQIMPPVRTPRSNLGETGPFHVPGYSAATDPD